MNSDQPILSDVGAGSNSSENSPSRRMGVRVESRDAVHAKHEMDGDHDCQAWFFITANRTQSR